MTSVTPFFLMARPEDDEVTGQASYSDPLLPGFWHLGDATGATKGANVSRVWDDYRGTGVIVAVIDDGVEYSHPDLAANYRADLDYDTRDSDSDAFPGEAGDRHGTTVSGVVGALLNNGAGGAGVAPEASLVGYRIGFGANGTLGQLLDAYQRLTAVDVANNSWGFDGFFGDNFLDPDFAPIGNALDYALDWGRGGLGTIVVFSAGNGRTSGQDVNYHGFQNHRGTIAVAATDSAGNVTYYSTPGAALLVSAPGSGIQTTDRVGAAGYSSGDYATMNGTSFSAPVVSGIAALMLDANPGLGWRDVQEILAATAVRTGSAAGWSFNGADNWNGGGMHVSHDYGFGLVDAYAAVRLAESWRLVSTSGINGNEWAAAGVSYPYAVIPDGNGNSVHSTITLAEGLRVDSVEVDVVLTHPNIGQLQVTLTAPDGTQSLLMHNAGTSQANLYFTFSTTRDWGELSGGNWTLTVTDTQPGASGMLSAWAVRAYGDLAGDDTYVYTGEFAALAAADPSRQVLVDAGGTDTLNATAIASDTLLDLRPGHTAVIGGQILTISAGTIIENGDTGDGNDTLLGNDAANSLRGWRGNDFLDGGLGADRLEGGAGNDVYVVDSTGDVVVEWAGGGSDELRTTLASYILAPELENLRYLGSGSFKGTGNAAANVITGGAGKDTLDGGLGADTLVGGAGDDTYKVENEGDTLVEAAGEGTDIVYSSLSWTLGPNLERLSLSGSAEIDATGNELANVLYGQSNSARNVLAGGLGSDLYYVGANDIVVEQPDEGSADIVYSTVSWTLGENIERLYLYGSGANVDGVGNALNNTLYGHANSLPNHLAGGLGNDTYYVGSKDNDTISEGVGEGTDTAYSYGDYTLPANVERLYLNVTTAASLNGNDLANNLRGNAGNDTLVGLAGNDSLDGGLGADSLVGGTGDDTYTVDDYGDTLVEAAGEGNDIVYSRVSWTLGENIERLYLSGSGADVDGIGNALNNTLYGHANSLPNHLAGGLGNDIYYVGNDDTISEGIGEGTDTAYSYGDYTLPANVEKLYLNVTTAASLNGNDLANSLRGNVGSDTLNGGLGNDTLAGRSGNDILTGGDGADIFRFDALLDASTNRDTVTDYSVLDDSIQLENAVFTSLTRTGTLAADFFVRGTAALDPNDYLIYDEIETGALFYDPDGNGATAPIEFAIVGTNLALTNLDFIVT